MSAIPASSVNLKTMADGTLRVSFDIEPMHAQDAFRLFAAPGTQAAIAALKAGTYLEQPKEPEKPKGGELARLAGIWCADPKFWAWTGTVHQGVYQGCVTSEAKAAEWVRMLCNIESRAELDNNKEAGEHFHQAIRLQYMSYLKANP